MTGKFFIVKDNKKKLKTSFYYEMNKKNTKHNHIIFKLSKKIDLIYNDVRKFGFLKILKSKNIEKESHLSALGPEPISKSFNFKYFKKNIINKKKNIKNILMDQHFVAGLGNIYVNEVLFLSGVHPKKSIKKISSIEIKKIIKNTKKILKKSIQDGGSSIKDFSDSFGEEGKFQQNFNVYGKEGGECIKIECKNTINKIYIANRATFFCKSCQK
jgi:formamidopyrimidine-DNA glycosylase